MEMQPQRWHREEQLSPTYGWGARMRCAAVGGAYEDFPGDLHFLWCVKHHGQKNILVLAESVVAAATPRIYTT